MIYILSDTFRWPNLLSELNLLSHGSRVGILTSRFRASKYIFNEMKRQIGEDFSLGVTSPGLFTASYKERHFEAIPIGVDNVNIRGRRYDFVITDELTFNNKESQQTLISLITRSRQAATAENTVASY
jgi:hypothetical protein